MPIFSATSVTFRGPYFSRLSTILKSERVRLLDIFFDHRLLLIQLEQHFPFKFKAFQPGGSGSIIGSPNGRTGSGSILCDRAVTVKACGVGISEAMPKVVIAEAKNTRNSNNKTFKFNCSPPFIFFIPYVSRYGWKGKKLYGIIF